MFKSNDDYKLAPTTNIPAPTPEPETIIGHSVKVDGNFKGDGNVIIEGEIKGSIKTKKEVRVGQQAKVKANIEAANAYIAGEVHGNIKTREKLELSGTAQVIGDLTTKSLQIAAGAKLNGQVKMDEDSFLDHLPSKRDTKSDTNKPGSKKSKNK